MPGTLDAGCHHATVPTRTDDTVPVRIKTSVFEETKLPRPLNLGKRKIKTRLKLLGEIFDDGAIARPLAQ